MAAAAAKQPAAQEAVVNRVYGRVRRLAGTLCAGSADADDVTQQTLLEILRSAGSFRVEASFERWVDRITIRCARGAARREGRRKGLLARWLLPGRLPWGADLRVSADEPVELDGVLARLTEERREVLILRHGLGYGVDEIAEMLNTRRGTVKDRLVSGKKQLRKMLLADLKDRGWVEDPSKSALAAAAAAIAPSTNLSADGKTTHGGSDE